MEYHYLGLVIFKLILCVEIERKFVLVRISDHLSILSKEEIGNNKDNTITLSRSIKKEGRPNQQEQCCRDEGVPDVCFGYCEKENKEFSRHSRRQMAICDKWLKIIGKCIKDRKVSGIEYFWKR